MMKHHDLKTPSATSATSADERAKGSVAQVHVPAQNSGFGAAMAWATQHLWGFKAVCLSVAMGAVGVLAWVSPQTFRSFDERSDNWTWNMQTQTAPERRLVVVDIDEKSVHAQGAWPWPRRTLADLVKALNDEGAGLKLYDVVLPEGKDGDEALKAALSVGSPNVGGQIFSIDPKVTVQNGVLAGQEGSGPCSVSAQTGFGFIGNAADLAPSFARVGHLTPVIDPDGAVRQVPAFVCFEGKSYPALSLAGLMQIGSSTASVSQATAPLAAVLASASAPAPAPASASAPITSLPVTSSQNTLSFSPGSSWLVKGQSWMDAPWSVKMKNWPDFSLPLNESGQIRVSYRTPRSQFVSLSASDVMAHRVPKDLLNGAWVLVGSTAFGSGDAIPTPHGGAEGGLEVHAQLIAAALDQATPYTPTGSWMLQVVVVGLGLLSLLALSVLPNRKNHSTNTLGAGVVQWHQRERLVFLMPLAGVAAVGLSFGLHAWGLLSLNLWVGWSLAAAFLASGALTMTVGDLLVLRWQRSRLFENLARYLNEPVAQEVALQDGHDGVDARLTPVVVMAMNVRNFDRFSDEQGATPSAEFLNQYLSMLSTTLKSFGGELHHVQGTQVLAVWRIDPSLAKTAALESKGQALPLRASEQAVCAAQSLWDQSQSWVALRGGQDLELEMGLEMGEALLGSVGPSERRVHTVLGEPVLVAQALREMVAELSYPVLVGPIIVHDLVQDRSQVSAQGSGLSSSVFEMRQNSDFTSSSESQTAMDTTDQPPVSMNPASLRLNGQPLSGQLLQGLRLGEFLLPGTTQSRLVYACGLQVSESRLKVVSASESLQRVA